MRNSNISRMVYTCTDEHNQEHTVGLEYIVPEMHRGVPVSNVFLNINVKDSHGNSVPQEKLNSMLLNSDPFLYAIIDRHLRSTLGTVSAVGNNFEVEDFDDALPVGRQLNIKIPPHNNREELIRSLDRQVMVWNHGNNARKREKSPSFECFIDNRKGREHSVRRILEEHFPEAREIFISELTNSLSGLSSIAVLRGNYDAFGDVAKNILKMADSSLDADTIGRVVDKMLFVIKPRTQGISYI